MAIRQFHVAFTHGTFTCRFYKRWFCSCYGRISTPIAYILVQTSRILDHRSLKHNGPCFSKLDSQGCLTPSALHFMLCSIIKPVSCTVNLFLSFECSPSFWSMWSSGLHFHYRRKLPWFVIFRCLQIWYLFPPLWYYLMEQTHRAEKPSQAPVSYFTILWLLPSNHQAALQHHKTQTKLWTMDSIWLH